MHLQYLYVRRVRPVRVRTRIVYAGVRLVPVVPACPAATEAGRPETRTRPPAARRRRSATAKKPVRPTSLPGATSDARRAPPTRTASPRAQPQATGRPRRGSIRSDCEPAARRSARPPRQAPRRRRRERGTATRNRNRGRAVRAAIRSSSSPPAITASAASARHHAITRGTVRTPSFSSSGVPLATVLPPNRESASDGPNRVPIESQLRDPAHRSAPAKGVT